MVESDLFEVIDPVLRELGTVPEGGEEFGRPPLDVLRYYRRVVRLHWMPVLGRGLSVVAVLRQPPDVGFSQAGYRTLLTRLAMAVNGRFPPWRSPRAESGRTPMSELESQTSEAASKSAKRYSPSLTVHPLVRASERMRARITPGNGPASSAGVCRQPS